MGKQVVSSIQKKHISMIVAITLFIIDILLSKYINEKSVFLAIPNLKSNKIIAAITFLLLIYAIGNNKILIFIIYLMLLRIVDKMIYIAKK